MAEYFLGIDVSKGYADFALLDEQRGQQIKPFRLDDTRTGHDALDRIVRDFCKAHPDANLYAAVESTGGMEDNWLAFLRELSEQLPLKAARLNPSGVAQYVKADLTRTITDAVSALKIAEYLIAHRHKVRYTDPAGVLARLRPLWAMLTMYKKQRGQLSNSLHHLLYGAHPSLLIFCRKSIPQWILEVVRKYPTSSHLRAARIPTLAKIPYVTIERATKLAQAAKNDVASHTDATTATVIGSAVEQICQLNHAINGLEKELCAQGKSDDRVTLLCSFDGIAELSAVGLLLNMPDIESIPDAAHLASYWGLHPTFKESGDGHMEAHMSKAGRTQPRGILFMVTLSAICCNKLIRALYRRLVYRKKMSKMAAIGVCMHKISRIVYGMLRTNTTFDPAIDRAHQTKHVNVSIEKVVQAEEQRKRRYQPIDDMAPISNREKKKREKINGSQRTRGTKSGITADLSPTRKNVLVTI